MKNAISLPGVWPGFDVVAVDDATEGWLSIRLSPSPDTTPLCSRCLAPSPLIHDRRDRRIRERDILDRRVVLQVRTRRVDCLRCGRVTEHLSWLSPFARITDRMRIWVEALTRLLPIAHVAALTGLHWHSVKEIDRHRLEAEVGAFDAGPVRRLAMDEFALHKGHRYATVVIDAERKRVLWVGQGRSREAIRPFFELLADRCQQIQAVAMDMNTAFDLEVKAHCPNAEVVYDLFHVIARFGRDVVDRVRVDQANLLRHDKQARAVVKGARWLLLRNRDHLKEGQAVALDELLSANQPLATVYILRDALKAIWYAPSVRDGWRRWRAWQKHAIESGLEPLQRFARNIRPYLRGILASAIFPMHTSLLEGINNRIKVIKRMAYGFRDTTYFFLKIKSAFPGKAR